MSTRSPLYGVTFGSIFQANFVPYEFYNIGCCCRGIKLKGVELSIHEVEACINWSPVDGAQDLLLGRCPLSAPVVQRLQQTLTTNIILLLTNIIIASNHINTQDNFHQNNNASLSYTYIEGKSSALQHFLPLIKLRSASPSQHSEHTFPPQTHSQWSSAEGVRGGTSSHPCPSGE